MTRREEIVAAARSLVGTPYRHQGRVAGPRGGTDCVGVPVLVARSLGARAADWDVTGYRRLPDGYSLLRRLRGEFEVELGQENIGPGDIIVLDWGQYPHHVGVLGDHPGGGVTLIHADTVRKAVIEQRLVIDAPARFVTAFQFPGVENV